jgi:hypothetical protein
MRAVAAFVVACSGLLAIGDSPFDVGHTPCALSIPNRDSQPCTPFVLTPARILATFPTRAFRAFTIDAIAPLSDGSLAVAAGDELFRVRSGGVEALWGSGHRHPRQRPWVATWTSGPPPTPPPTAKPYDAFLYLLGTFGDTALIQYGTDWLFGIGNDGAINFRFYRANSELGERPTFFGRDPDGTLWFQSGNNRIKREAVYALYPNGTLAILTAAVSDVFQASSGFVYATSGRDLVQLRSIPYPQARSVHESPVSNTDYLNSLSGSFTVRRLGSDKSVWLSTPNFIFHEHRDGQIIKLRLVRDFTTISHMPKPFEISSSTDGSVWFTHGSRVVRITRDDRIQVMILPKIGYYPDLRLAPDGSAWVRTDANDRSILHIAPPAE